VQSREEKEKEREKGKGKEKERKKREEKKRASNRHARPRSNEIRSCGSSLRSANPSDLPKPLIVSPEMHARAGTRRKNHGSGGGSDGDGDSDGDGGGGGGGRRRRKRRGEEHYSAGRSSFPVNVGVRDATRAAASRDSLSRGALALRRSPARKRSGLYLV